MMVTLWKNMRANEWKVLCLTDWPTHCLSIVQFLTFNIPLFIWRASCTLPLILTITLQRRYYSSCITDKNPRQQRCWTLYHWSCRARSDPLLPLWLLMGLGRKFWYLLPSKANTYSGKQGYLGSVMGWIVSPRPQNAYLEALTPGTSERDCIWRWSL